MCKVFSRDRRLKKLKQFKKYALDQNGDLDFRSTDNLKLLNKFSIKNV